MTIHSPAGTRQEVGGTGGLLQPSPHPRPGAPHPRGPRLLVMSWRGTFRAEVSPESGRTCIRNLRFSTSVILLCPVWFVLDSNFNIKPVDKCRPNSAKHIMWKQSVDNIPCASTDRSSYTDPNDHAFGIRILLVSTFWIYNITLLRSRVFNDQSSVPRYVRAAVSKRI